MTGRVAWLEMNDIEQAAFQAWMAEGPNMKEHVALIVDGEFWYMLDNVAEPIDGRGEFMVEGENIVQVMTAILMEHGEDAPRTLWHTHTATTWPSDEDIAEFPDWLCSMGAIYHVPTGTTTLYNQSGIISSSNSVDSGPIATQE